MTHALILMRGFLITGVVLLASPLWAAHPDASTTPSVGDRSVDRPAPIVRFAEQGATITPLGQVGGLAAFEVLPALPSDGLTPRSAAPRLFYATPEGGVIFGLIYDRQGRALTPPFSSAARARIRALAAAYPSPSEGADLSPPRSASHASSEVSSAPLAQKALLGQKENPLSSLSQDSSGGVPTQNSTPAESAQASTRPSPQTAASSSTETLGAWVETLSDDAFLRLTDGLVEAAGFAIGPTESSLPVVTAFLEPRCPWCRAFWQHLAPLARAGKLRLRVLAVDVFSETGQTTPRAMIAAAPQARQALWEAAVRSSGAPPSSSGQADAQQNDQRQAQIAILLEAAFARWHPARSVPFALWQTDGALRETTGLPDQATLEALVPHSNKSGVARP